AERKPSLETALGTRWAVWVGGIALALGGIFLVRYSIEAGLFGPGLRVGLAAAFGLVLLGAGEFVRRSGFRLPDQAASGAYVPAILTAAGAFTLFGAVYAAHAIYGFIGAAPAFLLLGLIGMATLALALLHGQAVAGVGLLGSFVTPVLVASEAPDPWTLFAYLAIVLVASVAVSRLRRWILLASAAYAGIGLWELVYIAEMSPVDLRILVFVNAVVLASLALIWARPAIVGAAHRVEILPSVVPAFFVALFGAAMLVDPEFQALGGTWPGAALLAAMLAVAAWRGETLPLAFGAAVAVVLAYMRIALVGTMSMKVMGEPFEVEAFGVLPGVAPLLYPGVALAVLFIVLGLWKARRTAGPAPRTAACWAALAALVPTVVVAACWMAMGDPNTDVVAALAALAVAAGLAVGAERIARAEAPPLRGEGAVSFAAAGAGASLVLAIHAATGPGLTTMLIGAAAVLPALATRWRSYPVLGWLPVASAAIVLLRAAIDPTLVGAPALGTTPVLNALLPGYGIPTLAFGFAAWQIARTTGGRPRLAMEALAALFALLTVAMLVRHAMHGGVIDASEPTLAEQAIYTLIALGFGAILISIDVRSPSAAMRWGSIGIGVASVAAIVVQHFILLDPLFTDEPTGRIPLLNLLFIAYLLPALAAAGLAVYARGKRPQWYGIMLGTTAAALAFAYATLSVRRIFWGERIGWQYGLGQLETYSYSALWLVMGVGLLVAGVRTGSFIMRGASGALIAIAVAKVFLFDMSNLEGVLRALSFIGLGAVLIGIGLFYQRLLRRAAA
ncbi:MAG: DUF2339 domain-containing protein, partial [Rhizobiaceae bacterium]|nr:DUF2339 domain-containing protein [Rhizobiaceae bacterium]